MNGMLEIRIGCAKISKRMEGKKNFLKGVGNRRKGVLVRGDAIRK